MAQPFVRDNEVFNFLTKIGLSKFGGKYNGFSTILSSTSSPTDHTFTSTTRMLIPHIILQILAFFSSQQTLNK